MLPLNESSISQNVLGKIIEKKKIWLEKRMKEEPLETFKDGLQPSDRSLEKAMRTNKTNFILECKKASPSKGLIRPDFNVREIASVYENYAQAVSVLAEEDFFQGNVKFIAEARECFSGPVICKDFIIDPYQIYLARRYGADAVLLMLSVLPDESYRQLADLASSLNLDVLTEASNSEEIDRAIALNARIIGINNRDLRNLTVDLSRTEKLAGLIPDDRVKICESGIYTHQDVLRLAPHVNGFLVGSSLTSKPDITMACRALIYGNNKVCGLTRHSDAAALSDCGGSYGGLIFVPGTPRCVTLDQAEQIMKDTHLKYVGVFMNATNQEMIAAARRLNLFALQLHGSESVEQIKELKVFLPHTKIWKAVPVQSDLSLTQEMLRKYITCVDKIVLDTKIGAKCGGTGVTFDWSVITQLKQEIEKYLIELNKSTALVAPQKIDNSESYAQKAANILILAGGLNLQNASAAVEQHTFGLDFNSGLESAPGQKDPQMIKDLFKILRNY